LDDKGATELNQAAGFNDTTATGQRAAGPGAPVTLGSGSVGAAASPAAAHAPPEAEDVAAQTGDALASRTGSFAEPSPVATPQPAPQRFEVASAGTVAFATAGDAAAVANGDTTGAGAAVRALFCLPADMVPLGSPDVTLSDAADVAASAADAAHAPPSPPTAIGNWAAVRCCISAAAIVRDDTSAWFASGKHVVYSLQWVNMRTGEPLHTVHRRYRDFYRLHTSLLAAAAAGALNSRAAAAALRSFPFPEKVLFAPWRDAVTVARQPVLQAFVELLTLTPTVGGGDSRRPSPATVRGVPGPVPSAEDVAGGAPTGVAAAAPWGDGPFMALPIVRHFLEADRVSAL
jgi:hypothetical protein